MKPKIKLRQMQISDIPDVIKGEEEIFNESLGYDMLKSELTLNPYLEKYNLEPAEVSKVTNNVMNHENDGEVKAFKVYPSGYMEITLEQGNKVIDMSAMGYAETFSTQVLPELDKKDKKLVHIAGTISKHFKTKKYVLNIVDIVAA